MATIHAPDISDFTLNAAASFSSPKQKFRPNEMTFAVKVISQLIKEGPHIKSTDASKIGNSDAYLNIQDAVLRNCFCHVWLTLRQHHKLESFQFNQKLSKITIYTVGKNIASKLVGFSFLKSETEIPFIIFMICTTWTISTPWHEMKATKLRSLYLGCSKNVIKAKFIGIFVISSRLSTRNIF